MLDRTLRPSGVTNDKGVFDASEVSMKGLNCMSLSVRERYTRFDELTLGVGWLVSAIGWPGVLSDDVSTNGLNYTLQVNMIGVIAERRKYLGCAWRSHPILFPCSVLRVLVYKWFESWRFGILVN